MGKTKSMCKWSRSDINKSFDEFSKTVASPTHACGKCGRVANSKKALCKPLKLSK